MTDNFVVQGEYRWVTNAPEVMEKIARGLRDVIDLTNRLKSDMDGLAGALGGLRELRGLLRSIKAFSVPDKTIDSLKATAGGMTDIAAAAEKARDAAREAAEAIKSIPKVEPPVVPGPRPAPEEPGAPRTPGPKPPSMGHIATSVAAGVFDAQMYGSAAAAVMRPAYDLAKSRTQLLANNTPDQADAAIAEARRLQQATPGTNIQGNIEVYRQLMSLTQNPTEARELIGAFLPAGVAMATFNPDAGSYDQQLEATIKSAEFKGALSRTDPKTGRTVVDGAGARHIGDLILGMQVVSQGQINSDTMLRFLRSGGTAAANMDVSELPFLSPVIQALGPARAGTGLQGFEQQFSSGKMSQAALNMLRDMGIVSKDPSKVRKLGMGMFMLKPGAVKEKDFEDAVFHPREFLFDRLLPQTQAYNAKNYGKAYTDADADKRRVMDSATMQQFASRIPGGTFMGELLRNLALSVRDGSAFGKLDTEQIKKTMAGSPQVAVESFFGALKDLVGVLGGAPFKDAIGALNALTATLNALAKAAAANPKAAGDLSTGGTDLVLGATVGGVLSAAGKTAAKYGFTKFAVPLALAGKTIGRLAIGFAVDRLITGFIEALGGDDPAKWIDKHIPGAGWLDRTINHATGGLIGHDYSKDPPATPQSYRTQQDQASPSRLQPVNLIIDGRMLGQILMPHLTQARTGPTDSLNFNTRVQPMRPGQSYAI